MSPDFDKAFKDLMDLEGWGRAHNVEGDSGGLTVYGIAKNYWPSLYEDGPPSEARAMQFYRETYWYPLGCHLMASHKMAFEIFEFSVNSGDGAQYEHAVAIAQQATNRVLFLADKVATPNHLKVDGIMGQNTQSAMLRAAAYEKAWVKFFNHYQLDYYMSLPEDQQRRFLLGWTRRT